MSKSRLEAFSDGVIAIIITIMVLEMKVPHGADAAALEPLIPVFLSYVLSFVFVGIYWNNHHHMLHLARTVNGRILWANLHLLFWLSLVPFTTRWLGEHGGAWPTALYGADLLMAAVAYTILERALIANDGPGSALAGAVRRDTKEKLSLLGYTVAIPIAFVQPRVADAIYVGIALVWLVPDRRIESRLANG